MTTRPLENTIPIFLDSFVGLEEPEPPQPVKTTFMSRYHRQEMKPAPMVMLAVGDMRVSGSTVAPKGMSGAMSRGTKRQVEVGKIRVMIP